MPSVKGFHWVGLSDQQSWCARGLCMQHAIHYDVVLQVFDLLLSDRLLAGELASKNEVKHDHHLPDWYEAYLQTCLHELHQHILDVHFCHSPRQPLFAEIEQNQVEHIHGNLHGHLHSKRLLSFLYYLACLRHLIDQITDYRYAIQLHQQLHTWPVHN